MNFKGEFIKLGEYDISLLKSKVESIPESVWHDDAERQKIFEAHKDTQTIKLIYDDDFRHENPTQHPLYEEYRDLVAPIMEMVSSFYSQTVRQRRIIRKHGPGFFIRAILVRLRAQGEIQAHRDSGYSLSRCHRIHIPIITNENTVFSVGDTSKVLRAGEIWEINNRLLHSVKNNGDQARIHLILDFVLSGETVLDLDEPLIA